MSKINHSPFLYGELTFIPYRSFNEKETGDYIVKRIMSGTYGVNEISGWNITDFYNASGDSEADIFVCLNNLLICIPGSACIFTIEHSDLLEDESCFEKFLESIEEYIDYHTLLCGKVDREFDGFKTEMLKKTPSEIINAVYEIAIKEELMLHIESSNILEADQDKAKLLYECDYPLDALYNEWLHNELTCTEYYDSTIDDYINVLKRRKAS